MKSELLESTAYHEAGHAVAAYYRYYPFKHVTVIPDETAGSLGHILYRPLRSFKNIEFDITPTLAKRIEDKVVISLAGGIAQRKFHKRGYWSYHTSSDNQSAVDLALRVNGTTEAADAYLHWLYICARQLVECHWKDICAVANELKGHKTISHEDVDRAIHIASGQTEAQWLSWRETVKTLKRAFECHTT